MENVLLNWIAVSSYSIQALDQCMTKCKRFIRLNTIISLAFSTASGSLSVIGYSKNASLALNILLTVFSFTITILGSVVKVYQYQERLELYIKTKQDWINFASSISTEIELNNKNIPIDKYKNDYNKLLQTDYELFGGIKKDLKKQKLIEESSIVIPKSSGLRIHDILIFNATKNYKNETVINIEEGVEET
jgi:hypothetical protein